MSAVNDKNPDNLWTPLHMAAYHNSVDTVDVTFLNTLFINLRSFF